MDTSKVLQLRRQIRFYYDLFKSGHIDKKEYLATIKPLDTDISNIEMSLFIVDCRHTIKDI